MKVDQRRDQIVDRLRRATEEITGQPARPIGSSATGPVRSLRSRRLVGLAAAGVLVVGGAAAFGFAATRNDPVAPPIDTASSDVVTIPGASITPATEVTDTTASSLLLEDAPVDIDVRYERVEFTIQSDLVCPNPIDTTGNFSSGTIETWIDSTSRRWKNTVTYPDGSTRDLIATGSVVYPKTLSDRGAFRGGSYGCSSSDGETVELGSEPGQSWLYSLNIENLMTPSEQALYYSYQEDTTLQPDEVTDVRGRRALLWRGVTTGFGGYETESPPGNPITQTTEVYVSPDTGLILQRSFTNTWAQFGTVTLTESLTEQSDTTVNADFFDTTGFSPLETTEMPVASACSSQPLPPPLLPDGSDPGDPALSEPDGSGGRFAIWGNPSSIQVLQGIGYSYVAENFNAARAAGETIISGPWEALVTPLDEVDGVMVIELFDTRDSCLRRYQIQPGMSLEAARSYARTWIDAIAN